MIIKGGFTISGGNAEQRGSIKFKGELSAVFVMEVIQN